LEFWAPLKHIINNEEKEGEYLDKITQLEIKLREKERNLLLFVLR
jgi:hypothetical protein